MAAACQLHVREALYPEGAAPSPAVDNKKEARQHVRNLVKQTFPLPQRALRPEVRLFRANWGPGVEEEAKLETPAAAGVDSAIFKTTKTALGTTA